MKYNDWIKQDETEYIKMFYESEEILKIDESEETVAVVESADFLNEAPKVDGGNFNVIAWVRLRTNANKLKKAEIAVRMTEIDASVMKRTEKWAKMNKDQQDTFNKRSQARTKAMKDKVSAIETKIDDIAGGSARLKKMATFLKNRATVQALEAVIKKAEKGMAKSTVADWKTTLDNAKKKDADFASEVEKDVKKLEKKAKEDKAAKAAIDAENKK